MLLLGREDEPVNDSVHCLRAHESTLVVCAWKQKSRSFLREEYLVIS